MLKKYIPSTIFLFLKVYLVVIVIFTLFRVVLFLTELERIGDSSFVHILQAFVMGIRFDIVISSYIMFIPFLVITIFSLFKIPNNYVLNSLKFYIIVLFSFAFSINAADIPYFNYFFSRFSVSAFQWIDSPLFVIKMVFQEPRYWLVIVPLLLLFFGFYKLITRLFLTFKTHTKQVNLYWTIGLSVFFLVLMLAGIRGRIEEKSPIRVGTAYFCNNPFLNQLGLNPNFTLMRSFLDSRKKENQSIALIDDQVAIANVQSYLKITKPNADYPLLRKIDFDTLKPTNHNVVLIIMESMSAAKMSRHGNTDKLTPFLDSISHCGYYFENAYTAGIHTMNGIFSTLFSFPALFMQHPMKEASMPKYNGIFSTLKANNYSTIYFTTHDGQFDNVEGFLKANDCERVISKADYPQDKVKTTLGVPDDFMFEFSIPILNKLSQKNKPFVAAFMTASDHGPYFLPEYFKPKNTEIKKQIVEYADFSLNKFINSCSKQEWFENTIFVFIADHGAAMDNLYDMSIDYHHSPLLFYSPSHITEHKTYSNIAGQIDIFPTLMGLLQLPYYNNTLGIDLLRESRDHIFLNADDKYGVINNEWFLIVKNDNTQSLFRYKDKDLHNYSAEKQNIANEMDTYAKSNLQAFQYVKNNNKQAATIPVK